jgi:hypothetical protein
MPVAGEPTLKFEVGAEALDPSDSLSWWRRDGCREEDALGSVSESESVLALCFLVGDSSQPGAAGRLPDMSRVK